MRMLMVGCGGVGEAIVKILKGRDPDSIWLKKVIMTSSNSDRSRQLAEKLGDKDRFIGESLDAHNIDDIVKMAVENSCDFIMDAAAPFVSNNIFDAAYIAGCHYMNMGTWSEPGKDPFNDGFEEMMGEHNFLRNDEWQEKGKLALLGMGIDPGVVDVFACFAARRLFDEVEEIHVRDGNNITVKGMDVAFGFNVWTVLDECLNPNLEWKHNKGYIIEPPFSGEEMFEFPEGVGLQKVYKVEHEEVVFMPRYLEKYGLKRCTFKIALDDNLVNALKVLNMMGLRDTNRKVHIGEIEMSPRDIISRAVAQPTDIGSNMHGKICVGVEVIGIKDGLKRDIFLYQSLDNQVSMQRLDCQAVLAQTGYGAAIAIELLGRGIWKGSGVHAPEHFDPEPYMRMMEEYGFHFGFSEWDSEYERAREKSYFARLLSI